MGNNSTFILCKNVSVVMQVFNLIHSGTKFKFELMKPTETLLRDTKKKMDNLKNYGNRLFFWFHYLRIFGFPNLKYFRLHCKWKYTVRQGIFVFMLFETKKRKWEASRGSGRPQTPCGFPSMPLFSVSLPHVSAPSCRITFK